MCLDSLNIYFININFLQISLVPVVIAMQLAFSSNKSLNVLFTTHGVLSILGNDVTRAPDKNQFFSFSRPGN